MRSPCPNPHRSPWFASPAWCFSAAADKNLLLVVVEQAVQFPPVRRRIFTILCPGSLVQRGSVAVDRTKRLLERMTVRRWLLVCAALLALSIEACCWSYRLGEISGRASVAKRQPEEMAPTRPATVTEALTAVVPFPTTTVAESNVEDLIGDIEEEERLRTQLQEIGAGPDYVEARVQTLIAEQAKRRKH